MNNFTINVRKTKVDELKIFAYAVNICEQNAKFSRKRALVNNKFLFLKTLATVVCKMSALIKKKRKFSLYIMEIIVEQLQSHMRKGLLI